MASPQISIVIPTYRRPVILAACLEHLERQTIADRIEAIVVSDGHDPATVAAVTGKQWKVPVTFREIPKSQQAVARNTGVREAKGDLVLFLGDDALLAPGACEAHLRSHRGSQPCAVLGRVDWDPTVGITPVMRWLDASSRQFHGWPFKQLEGAGWQFDYPALEPYAHARVPAAIQHRFTYTINLSVPTDVALAHPFREDLSLYGWEDIAWGLELAKAGIPLHYQPDARALHRHKVELADSLKRMQTLGASLRIVTDLVPDLGRMPSPWKLRGYRLLALLPTMRGRHAKALLEGLR